MDIVPFAEPITKMPVTITFVLYFTPEWQRTYVFSIYKSILQITLMIQI